MKITSYYPKYYEMIGYHKDMIIDSIKMGEIPRFVEDYSALHDHVDANEYLISLCERFGMDNLEDTYLLNKITRGMDRWIQKGGIATRHYLQTEEAIRDLRQDPDEDQMHELARDYMSFHAPDKRLSLCEFMVEEDCTGLMERREKNQGHEIVELFSLL